MSEPVRVRVGLAQFDVPAEKADEVNAWLTANLPALGAFQTRFPEAVFVTDAPLGGSTRGPFG